MKMTATKVVYYQLLCCTQVWMIFLVEILIELAPEFPGLLGLATVIVTGLVLGLPFFACIGVGFWVHRRPVAARSPPPPAPGVVPQAPDAPGPPVVIPASDADLLVCSSCGAINPQGKRKCSNCGAAL